MIEESIRELDHGDLEGLTFNEIKQNYGEFLAALAQRAGGAASARRRALGRCRRARLAGAQSNRRAPSSRDTIVVVSHNFPIVGIVCRITGTHLNEYRNFHLDPCGMSRLNRNGDGSLAGHPCQRREYAKHRGRAIPN